MSENLTIESLKGICKNNFELAHYAIALGRYLIKSGKEANLADVIKEIKKHPNPNYVNELKEIEKIEKERDAHRYEGKG